MLDRRILAKNQHTEITSEVTQLFHICRRNTLLRDTGNFRDDGFNFLDTDGLFTLLGLQTTTGTGFIDNVDCLVWQKAIIHITICELGSCFQRVAGVLNIMKRLKVTLETFEYLDGLRHGRLGHINLLESS